MKTSKGPGSKKGKTSLAVEGPVEQKTSGEKLNEKTKRKRKKKNSGSGPPAVDLPAESTGKREKEEDLDADVIDGIFEELKAKKKAKVANESPIFNITDYQGTFVNFHWLSFVKQSQSLLKSVGLTLDGASSLAGLLERHSISLLSHFLFPFE